MTAHLIPPQFRMTRFSASIFRPPYSHLHPLPTTSLKLEFHRPKFHFHSTYHLTLIFFSLIFAQSSLIATFFSLYLSKFPSLSPQHSPLSSLCSETFVANPFPASICIDITLCVTTFLSQQSILKLDLKCTFLSQICKQMWKNILKLHFLASFLYRLHVLGIKKQQYLTA